MPGFERGVPTEQTKDIYAIRRFTYDCYGDIVGLTYRQPILKGVNEAQCGVRKDHQVPEVDCSCGFYCFDSYANEANWLQNYQNFAAIVKVSGRVLVCPEGLRAEKIEIVAVYDRINAANQLGVPNYTDFEIMKSEFPLAELERAERDEDVKEADPNVTTSVTSSFFGGTKYTSKATNDSFLKRVGGEIIAVGNGIKNTVANLYKDVLIFGAVSAVFTAALFMILHFIGEDWSPSMYALPTIMFSALLMVKKLNRPETLLILFSIVTTVIICIIAGIDFVAIAGDAGYALQTITFYSVGLLAWNLISLTQKSPVSGSLKANARSAQIPGLLTTRGNNGYDNRRLPARLSNNSEGR